MMFASEYRGQITRDGTVQYCSTLLKYSLDNVNDAAAKKLVCDLRSDIILGKPHHDKYSRSPLKYSLCFISALPRPPNYDIHSKHMRCVEEAIARVSCALSSKLVGRETKCNKTEASLSREFVFDNRN